MKANNVTTISNRSKVLKRPARFIGAVSLTETDSYDLKAGKLVQVKTNIVPGLMKIFEEVIDNSIDEAIRTNYKFANLISITTSKGEHSVEDNGRGIPVKPTLNEDGSEADYLMPEGAWTKLNTGSNFDDEDDNTTVGQNGEGVALTCIFSKSFKGETCDGSKKLTLVAKDNMESYDIDVANGRKKYTKVTFTPDYKLFGVKEWNASHETALKYKLMMLSLTYPDIKFTLNGQHIKVPNFKKFVQMLSPDAEVIEADNISVAVIPNNLDDFRFIHFVNGINSFNGGKPLEWVLGNITGKVKDLAAKKYPNMKVGDVKNKMFVVAIFRNMHNPRFGDQIKSVCENTFTQFKDTIGDINWDAYAKKVFKNKAITDPILETYKLKEEAAKRLELKKLEKPKKKIRSEKYVPAIGKRKYLMICEGASASGGLMPALGREEFGYFELKGKPLNAYSAKQSDFNKNEELTLLYQIIKTEGYEYYIYATDQDLDGFLIRGLLTGFFDRYVPDQLKLGRVGMFQTPIMSEMKNGLPSKWVYNVREGDSLKGEVKYFKGLGSHTERGLQHIVETDGIQKMIQMLEYDEEASETIDAWLNTKRADDRKEFLRQNEFDLINM